MGAPKGEVFVTDKLKAAIVGTAVNTTQENSDRRTEDQMLEDTYIQQVTSRRRTLKGQ